MEHISFEDPSLSKERALQRVPAFSSGFRLDGKSQYLGYCHYGSARAYVTLHFDRSKVNLESHEAYELAREANDLMRMEKPPVYASQARSFHAKGTPATITRFWGTDLVPGAKNDWYSLSFGVVSIRLSIEELTQLIVELQKAHQALSDLDQAYRSEHLNAVCR